MSNEQKVAIVTGASQGIGAALVKAYRDRNYRVVATSRSIKQSADADNHMRRLAAKPASPPGWIMISEDEYLERVVAGIQAATTTDAEVQWNEKIEGRQFDVAVRFRLGSLRYLAVFEVKNKTRKTPAEALDAFVTKARDQKANKMVFVSASGFQTGALAVAKRHGVDLFTVTFDEANSDLPQQLSGVSMRNPEASDEEQSELGLTEPTLAASVIDVRITYVTGPAAVLPNEPSQLNYYLQKTRLTDGRALIDVVSKEDIFELKLDQELRKSAQFDPPVALSPPDAYFLRAERIIALDWKIVGRMTRFVTGNVKIDPGVFVTPVVYTNVLTGEVLTFAPDQLPLGLGPVEPGRFYFITNPLNYYYCDRITGDLIRWIMVESFQAGEFVQGAFTQKVQWSRTYIPVSDKTIIRRLQQRLQRYQERERRPDRMSPADFGALFDRPRRGP